MIPKVSGRSPVTSDLKNPPAGSYQSVHPGIPVQPHCNLHQLDDLLIDFSGAVVSTPPDRLHHVLIDALRRLVATLGADRSIFGFFDSTQLVVTHSYTCRGFPAGPASVTTRQVPWLLEQLCRGAVVQFSYVDDLPCEASIERAFCRRHGIQSCAILPLGSHGSSRFALGVGSSTKALTWHNETLRQMRLLGNVLAGAVKHQNTHGHQFVESVIQSMPGNFLVIDDHGRLVRWNHNVERVYGFSAQELSEMRAVERLCPEYRQNHETMMKACLRTGSAFGEYECVTKDGQRLPFRAQAVRTRIGNGRYIICVESDISEQRRTENRLRQLSGCLIGAQEEERHRLARELHDDISQRLALLAAKLDLFARTSREDVGIPSDSANTAARLVENIQVLASDVQKIAHGLHPAKLDRLGLSTALRSLCRDIGSLKTFRMRCFVQEIARGLSPPVALCLYRVAQESLHNVVRHSSATEVSVTLRVHGSELRLVVVDNGVGFDSESESTRNGLGIISMKERLRQVSGVFALRSNPGNGTRIEACIPCANYNGRTSNEVSRREPRVETNGFPR